MSVNTTGGSNLTEQELEALLEAARSNSDRRVDIRHAFFTAVTLRSVTAPSLLISAFSREISVSGIGLLHGAPIVVGANYEIDIRIEDFRVHKTARVIWCRNVGDGWFVSGCRFL